VQLNFEACLVLACPSWDIEIAFFRNKKVFVYQYLTGKMVNEMFIQSSNDKGF